MTLDKINSILMYIDNSGNEKPELYMDDFSIVGKNLGSKAGKTIAENTYFETYMKKYTTTATSSAAKSSSGSSTVTNTSGTASETSNTQSAVVVAGTSLAIVPIYTDVKIDETAKLIKLSNSLTVRDFLNSFNITDGYSLKLVNSKGEEITDQTTYVQSEQKLQIIKDNKVDKEFSIDALKISKTGSGVNVLLVLVIVMGIVIIAGAVFALFYILKLKKSSN